MDTTFPPILVRFGGAKKSSFDMNNEELKQAAGFILKRAKEKAFYKGLPVYYAEGDALIAEYADGRIEVVKRN